MSILDVGLETAVAFCYPVPSAVLSRVGFGWTRHLWLSRAERRGSDLRHGRIVDYYRQQLDTRVTAVMFPDCLLQC